MSISRDIIFNRIIPAQVALGKKTGLYAITNYSQFFVSVIQYIAGHFSYHLFSLNNIVYDSIYDIITT